MDHHHVPRALLLAVLITATTAQVAMPTGTTISVDISQSHAHVGDNVTVTCRVNEKQEGETVYMMKTLVRTDGIDSLDIIATEDSFLPPYARLDRYHISKVEYGSTMLYILNIYGVQSSDSGHIGCSIGEYGDNIYDMEQFDVYQNAMDISFINYTEGEVKMVEGEPITLACHVHDVRPLPNVKVMVDDHDVSTEFMHHQTLNVLSEGDILKDEPLHYSYNVDMTDYAFTATYEDHGKSVRCISDLLGSGLEPVEHSLPLNVEYETKFICEREVLAGLRAPRANITCDVSANPHPENATYVWHFRHGDSERQMHAGISQGMFSTGADRISPEIVRVSIVIFDVLDECFTDYTLMTGSLLGNASVTITLAEDTSNPWATDAAGTATWSPISAVLVLVISALLSMRTH